MSTEKTKHPSPADQADIAAAAASHAEAAHSTLTAERQRLDNIRLLDKVRLEMANDFDNGYIRLCDTIDDASTGQMTSLFRLFGRLHPKKPLTIELHSPGGHITFGFQMLDELGELRSKGHHVTIKVRGMAASMAGVLLQGADVRVMGANSFLMIHAGGFGSQGKTFEVEDELEFMKKLTGRICDVFSERSHRSKKYFLDLLDKRKDIYYSAEEAVKLGLADRIG
ncbi:MAG: ATP-dependent Clp protease proteolytic subunit [Sulfuritalea sp.]|jgi:ATP-dependent protease ClpP protease subunit|nr:ATP-dependent Clp protease proteolytic subunit [Sulfuritalea sp.]